jgi:hypothetical protein
MSHSTQPVVLSLSASALPAWHCTQLAIALKPLAFCQ